MNDNGPNEFQDDVNEMLGSGFNFHLDRAHDDKPEHVDLTTRFGFGADKVDVDYNGNIIGGSTFVGGQSMDWDS